MPPDNFQQHPLPVIAHRTSPTNIGLSLLANLSALDFGYISVCNFLERTDKTIATLNKMERYHGHFYNWYDTETLQPLIPKYISTVDSGNMAGHLLTLRQGIFEIINQKIAGPKIFDGLLDTLRVLRSEIDESASLQVFTTTLQGYCDQRQVTLPDIHIALNSLLADYLAATKDLHTESGSPAEWWKNVLLQQINDAIADFEVLSPWFSLPPVADKFLPVVDIKADVTLGYLGRKSKMIIAELSELNADGNTAEENEWIKSFIASVAETLQVVETRIAMIERLGHECIGLADVDWAFLYDKTKHLLTIGYKVDEHICDPGFYDLLASEARLCVFLAIAQGKLPEESWFALGRLLTKAGSEPILLSWSGSIFEYLMPLLVMPTYENTLLDQTYKATVNRQIDYGKQRGVPWASPVKSL